MSPQASDLARRLAERAEMVCRHYLSNGRRSGNYWLVGDVNNTPGRSLFVRLAGPQSGKGVAGKWTDAATGQHGDLLDVIQLSRGLAFSEAAEEARRFLSLPPPASDLVSAVRRRPAPVGSSEAARRLWAISQGVGGTLAQCYLADRGITHIDGLNSLRFHPRCYYRPDDYGPTETWPGLIAAVTDLGHRISGVHRTWLNPDGFDPITLGKAPIDTPRRAMGDLLGHAVRFGTVADVAAAGEGIETMLSLRMVMPAMPMLAALSAAHACRRPVSADTATALCRARRRSRRRCGPRHVARPGSRGRHRRDPAVTRAGRFQR